MNANRRLTHALTVVALSLLLRADSCTTNDRAIDVPVPFRASLESIVRNDTTLLTTVVDSLDLGALVRDALREVGSENVDELVWVGLSGRFTRNAGLDSTRHVVTDLIVPPAGGNGEIRSRLLTTDPRGASPDTRAGRKAIIFSAGEPFVGQFNIKLEPAGSTRLQTLVDELLEQYRLRRSPDDVQDQRVLLESTWTFRAFGVDGPRGAQIEDDDFTWRLDLNFQIVQRREVSVYRP